MSSRTVSSEVAFGPTHVAVRVFVTILGDMALLSALVATGCANWDARSRIKASRSTRPLDVQAQPAHVLGVQRIEGVLGILLVRVLDEGVAALVTHRASAEPLELRLQLSWGYMARDVAYEETHKALLLDVFFFSVR